MAGTPGHSGGRKDDPNSCVGKPQYVKNLFQYNATPEQKRAQALAACRANQERARRDRMQRDILKKILSLKCDDKEAVAALLTLGLEPDFANAANLAVIRRAVRGDVEALKYVRDTIGEKPADVTQLNLLDRPVAAQDLSQLSDAELEVLADRAEQEETAVALPPAQEGELTDE